MKNKNLDKFLEIYKEVLISRKNKNHIYFFTIFSSYMKKEISAHYIIDEFDNKWIESKFCNFIDDLSVEEQQSLFIDDENIHLKGLIAKHKDLIKYFDVNQTSDDYTKQLSFFRINKSNDSPIIQVINSNARNGTPRKFITNSELKKINIELDLKNINSNFFK